MVLALAAAVTGQGWGPLSWAAVGLVALLLVVEHGLVSPDDLSRVNASFFTVNGIVSVAFAALVVTDLANRAGQLWP